MPSSRTLRAGDYDLMKTGVCIVSGDYDGCIFVSPDMFYWITPAGGMWKLEVGMPDPDDICKIPNEDVWRKIKEGGLMTWDADNTYWSWLSDNYRIRGMSGKTAELVKV